MAQQNDSIDSVRSANPVGAALGSEESFDLLASCIHDYAIFMLDTDGRIASWNIGAERIYNYASAEIIGRHFSHLYPKEDTVDDAPGLELIAAAEQGRLVCEGWRARKEGARFLAHVVVTALRDGNGVLRGFAKVTRDISARKQLEERFRLVVESAPSAMVMINRSGSIEMVNAQAESVFGYQRAEMLGRPVEMLVPERFRQQHPGLRRSFYSDPHSRPMGAGRDLFGLRKDGSEFPIEIGLNPIETEEGPMVLSAIVDISDRKLKEEKIQAALREKDVLLGEIHHRVKNNLQIVHSLLDLQCNNIDDPAVLQMLKDSQNRIRSMAVIHQTLYQSNDFAAVDLSNVIGLIANSVITSFGIVDGRVALKISADEMPLSINKAIPCGLIINELITNSLKHAFPLQRAGTISIHLEQQAGVVKLVIEDDGVGIPDDVDPNLSGTLGLQLVNLLSEQIGGQLVLKRAAPTQFSLSFPLASDNRGT